MAIIKFVNKRPKLVDLIDYVTRKSKVFAIGGKDCLAESVIDEMFAVKQAFKKEDGRECIHIIQSFSPNDDVTPAKVNELGMKLAEYFKGYQVLVATHIDKNHLHNHLIVNSVNFENGQKYNQSREQLKQVKDYSNKLCMEAGLKVITSKSKVEDIKLGEYKSMERGESWKRKLISDIDKTILKSGSKYEFIRNMNELGYKVTWKKERKYITYTTPAGKRCRDIKLHNEKYLKDNMNELFLSIKQEKVNVKKSKLSKKAITPIQVSGASYNLQKRSKYKGELSKQAKKDYAIEKANAGSIDWEDEM